MYKESFRALNNESKFTYEMLATGATQIRKANYATKGIYYQAFTSLSTGLERIGKICLILDHYINTGGAFPDLDYMKRNIGHDLNLIYKKSNDIVNTRAITFEYLQSLDSDVHQEIIRILSDFAKGDRYSNINYIVTGEQKTDPMARWFDAVDRVLYEKHVTNQKKDKIIFQSRMMHELLHDVSLVRHMSETGEPIETVQDASFRTGMQDAVAVYRQLYVIQIIRYWVELISKLQNEAMKVGKEDIPFMNEIFAPFCNPDSYIKTRKTWDTI